jgi:hypothetical protein
MELPGYQSEKNTQLITEIERESNYFYPSSICLAVISNKIYKTKKPHYESPFWLILIHTFVIVK